MPQQRMYAFSVLLLSFWVVLLEKTLRRYSWQKTAVVLLAKTSSSTLGKHMVVLLQKTCSGTLIENLQ